ncbi:hypothetical protein Mapa_012496 [Marchantia paleacea]|nr:hypothetical protein Mapa_012496 [Marchantia paleacea]
MVKFAKQLEAQLVQEWRSAYCDYKLLKKDIKAVKESKTKSPQVPDKWQTVPLSPMTPMFSGPVSVSMAPARQVTRRLSQMQESFKTVVSVTGQAADALKSKTSSKFKPNKDLISVKKVESDGGSEVYTTQFNENFVSADATTRIFFARLDSEFNKVNKFYMGKEKEFLEQYQKLKEQVGALQEIRKELANPQPQLKDDSNSGNAHSYRPQTIAEAVEEAQKRRTNMLTKVKSLPTLDVLKEGNIGEVKLESDSDNYIRGRGAVTSRPAHPEAIPPEPEPAATSIEMSELESGRNAGASSRPDGSDSTKPHMRLNLPKSTPSTTIKSLTQSLLEDLQKQGISRHGSSDSLRGGENQFAVNKKNVGIAEKMLQTAFTEYYRGLTLLKAYSSLNMVAFAKIVKKFDKTSRYRTLPIYIKAVEHAHFNTSEKVIKLIQKTETLVAKTFAKDNHSKARFLLRPAEKKSSHIVTFFLGLFTGGSLALLTVYSTLLNSVLPRYIAPVDESAAPSPEPAGGPESIYLKTIFPLFSVSALIIIHMIMYGFNVYYCRKWKINYAFMFDFKQGTELRHREILMAGTVLMTILLAAMTGHVALHSVTDSPYVDFIPLGVFMILVILLFFPLNFFYLSSRKFLLICFIHLALAPLYKVVLPDFFLGDQLTSQVPMMRNFQYLVCYFTSSYFKTSNADGCTLNSTFRGFVYFISLLPYWWRFLQCLRRYFEEHDFHQFQNAGKYLSAMVAVGIRIQQSRSTAVVWTVLLVLSSIFATAFQIYWDLVVDWGVLRRTSKNKWLRDNLIMPRSKYIYFLAMISNVILRLAWVQSITRFRFGQMDLFVADFFFASLEVIRRGIWNFFRLENEHLNNVGKYRATKTVPLPFENPISQDYN